MMRCLVTGNECGTDTWQVGSPCGCRNCILYMLQSGPDRNPELPESIRVTRPWSPHKGDPR
jgi:hypothetical protein